MSPRAERTPPAYMQIASHYRQRIQDGELPEGTKLPSVKAVADEWGVSTATAAKGLGQLGVEGYIRTSPRGSFVEDPYKTATTPADRIHRSLRNGSLYAEGEHTRVTAAEIITAPTYVADLLGLEEDTDVVRREWVTIRGKKPAVFSVSWHPARFAELVPALLSTENSKARNLIGEIETALGRKVTKGRDDIEGRGADQREANHLGLPVGSPILAVVHRWYDDGDLIEYAEHCLPPKQPIGYDYTIEAH